MLNKYMKIVAVAVLAASASTAAHAHHVIGTITLPNPPEGLATDPLTNRIFVAVPNFGTLPYDYLTVIDGATDKVIKNIHIPPVAYAVAVDPVHGLIYVGGINLTTNVSEVVVVDEKTETVLGHIDVSSTPGDGILGLAFDFLNDRLYVSNGSDNEIDIIHSYTVGARIPLSGEPFGVAANPFIGRVYVALQNGNVSVINTATLAVTATTPVGSSDAGITVDFSTGKVYATNAVYTDSSTVGVLDTAGSVLANVPAGNTPIGIDVDWGTHNVFVANTQDGTVDVINGYKNFQSLPVSGLFLTVNPFSQKVYVGAFNGTSVVTVIDEK